VDVGHAEVLQGRHGEARRVALLAEHDDRSGVADHGRMTVLARRVEAPLDVVALDRHRPGDATELGPLELGSGVDQQRTPLLQPRCLGGLDEVDPLTCRAQQLVDG
jgi:hypothetical protein